MDELIEKEIEIYLEKIRDCNSIKETWVSKHLPNIYNFLSDKDGGSFSEKLYIYKNGRNFCKVCNSDVGFLSYKRGYREYCSKSCSNSDPVLCSKKIIEYKKTSLEKWGVDNASKSEYVREKIKKTKASLDYEKIYQKSKQTNLEKWGKENPSQNDEVKRRKKQTTLNNWGVDNPFQSGDLKEKIKQTNLKKWGFEHPIKNELVKDKSRQTNLEKWGVDNYTKSREYKEAMFQKWRSCYIKTNLNTNKNYIEYVGIGIHKLLCDNGGNHSYETNSHLYHARMGLGNKQCTICFPVNSTSSFKELELFEFIKTIYDGDIVRNYRDGYEIDIYIPDLNIGFEFNGIYWHCELFKNRNYHKEKSEYFLKKGIRIIHIWEDDWTDRVEILKSQIRNWLGITPVKIWARKCQIKEVKSVEEYRNFLNNNHIQGYTSSSIKIGLYYRDELVSLMTFDKFEGRKKMGHGEWNLSRFCNKINISVVGGASKLLSYFIMKWHPTRLISFSDNSWSDGDLYKKLGFNLSSISHPNYSYIIDKKRSNKQKWKKSNLVKMGFPKELSESKIMEDNFGSYKIFDCGQTKFELIIKQN